MSGRSMGDQTGLSAAAACGSGALRQTKSASSHGKPRSCVVCAKRKVSCDKQYPCGRCHRAGVRCVLPAVEQRPRWARRLVETGGSEAGAAPEASSPTSSAVPDPILQRFQQLESLVQSLRTELAQSGTRSSFGTSHRGSHAPAESSAHDREDGPPSLPAERGLHDLAKGSEDLSSRFWSGVGHELADFRDETGQAEIDQNERTTEDQSPQMTGTAFNNGSASVAMSGRSVTSIQSSPAATDDTSGLLPMVSQMPFLLDVYADRVHSVICVPHMSSLDALFRRSRANKGQDMTADENALVFAVLYAAICSLDDEEVHASFNRQKTDLASNYRKGLEISLAKADFLANPSHELVQALLIFMTLARLQDSPKYLWMMTGIVIRMARFLRYHQDGSESKQVTPFQAEMQRRVWWNLCALDMRATEDQGTELTNADGSFTTALPSNVDDGDIWPEMEQAPSESSRLTNGSLLRLCSKVARCTQKMIALGGAVPLKHHVKLIDSVTRELDRDYFSVTDQTQRQAYLAAAGTMRVFLARLNLLAFLPAMFSSSDVHFSTELRKKMLIAGIEIAELNHILNTDPSCQPWRWVYQTQQHWHAVVYLLIDICRRPWSATVERAWLALQSPWLLPARATSYKNPTVWVPLKRLMHRARSHREEELMRLRDDPHAAQKLEWDDREQFPSPSSSITFPTYYNEDMFQRQWRQLLSSAGEQTNDNSTAASSAGQPAPASNAFSQISIQHATSRMAERADLQHTSQPDGTDTISSSREQGRGVAMDASDFSNLDSFLGIDAEMETLDDMGDIDFLNFDWNSWFSSTNDVT